MPYCSNCIRESFLEIKEQVLRIHDRTRKPFGLPQAVTGSDAGPSCQVCVNKCSIPEGGVGYCGVRQNIDGRIVGPDRSWAYVEWYHDPLPTNCVADWVCKGSSDQGHTNLAVFYEACTFNCLFCQNWHFRKRKHRARVEELLRAADATTGCVCFFGGDPTPFAMHSMEIAIRLRQRRRKMRICWETNGSISPVLMEKWADHALATDGCLKIDFKTFDEGLNVALCGTSNVNTKRNIELLAGYMEKRNKPPLLVISTLLIPGYIDEIELRAMARFISSLSKDIPWSFLAFYPHFRFEDLPCTTHSQAEMALSIARDSGIKNAHLGNVHLLQ